MKRSKSCNFSGLLELNLFEMKFEKLIIVLGVYIFKSLNSVSIGFLKNYESSILV